MTITIGFFFKLSSSLNTTSPTVVFSRNTSTVSLHFEVLLYLHRWNWLFIRTLLELWCIFSTRMTSAGAVPLAGVAQLVTLLCKLLTTPSIILYLGKRFLSFKISNRASRLRTDFRCGYSDGLEKYSLPILKCLLVTIPHIECDCCCGHPN